MKIFLNIRKTDSLLILFKVVLTYILGSILGLSVDAAQLINSTQK